MAPLKVHSTNVQGHSSVKTRRAIQRTNFIIIIISVVVAVAFLLISQWYRIKHLERVFDIGLETFPAPLYIPPAKLVNASQFYLDPNWDLHAPPTIRTFNWTISEAFSAPGAINKRMIVVNEQSPGPLIEANLGDTIIVNVINNLSNATAIHWHGQFQRGTPFYDGTYGITQCGIPPRGGQMTYKFVVQNVGTYLYHAHYSTQYSDGLYGALILHSPMEPAITTIPYDREVVVMIGDIYNTYSQDLMERYTMPGTGINGQPGDEPAPDGGIINGISQARCAYTPSNEPSGKDPRNIPRDRRSLILDRKVHVQKIPENNTCVKDTGIGYASLVLKPGLTYRFRVINVGTFLNTKFSIDKHKMTVVEADGTSVKPIEIQSVELGVGQRYSLIVKLDQKAGLYWIRNKLNPHPLDYKGPEYSETTLAILKYDGIDAKALSYVAKETSKSEKMTSAPLYLNAFHFEPLDARDAPEATMKVHVNLSMGYDDSGNQYRSFFNRTSWKPLTRSSTLFQSADLLNPASNIGQLIFRTEDVEVIDIIIQSEDDNPHPLHLHGYKFFVLGFGEGKYIGQPLKTKNPMRRDTVNIQAYNWMVLRFVADNPGVWAFHCHINWHMETGMLMQFENLPREIAELSIPHALREACHK